MPKKDPQTGELIYYMAFVRDVPAAIRLTAGDVLQNARTALDHLACQLFLVNNPGIPIGRETSFPIFDDATKYAVHRAGKVAGMSNAAIDRIDSTKPYQGGNDNLWRLHRLNNIDKHRILVATSSGYQGRSITDEDWVKIRAAYTGSHVGKIMPDWSHIQLVGAHRDDWNRPLQVGYEFYRAPAGSEVNENMRPAITVTLEEPDVVIGESLIETIQEMLIGVEAVIIDCGSCL